MDYTNNYKKLLKKGGTAGKSGIQPLKIYVLKNYKGGDPAASERFLFVIGKVDDSIHCLKLNEIKPDHFINFLNKIIDKGREITEKTILTEITKKFKKDGSDLFERYVKKEKKIYSKEISSYRVYKLDKITSLTEMYFEPKQLKKFFSVEINDTIREIEVREESN